MVPSIHCSTLSDQATELLRTYLELGAYRIPYLWPWSPDTGTGEYAFDFAVVIFGVLLLVICQTVVLTPLVALRVLRTQAVNSPSLLYHFSLSALHYKDTVIIFALVYHLTLVVQFMHCIHNEERWHRRWTCVGLIIRES